MSVLFLKYCIETNIQLVTVYKKNRKHSINYRSNYKNRSKLANWALGPPRCPYWNPLKGICFDGQQTPHGPWGGGQWDVPPSAG